MTYALILIMGLMGGADAPAIAVDLSLAQCYTMRAALAQVGVPAACVEQQGV